MFGGGILEELRRRTECWRAKCFEAVLVCCGKFWGLENMVFCGSCVMRLKRWLGSNAFSWAIHCGSDGPLWDGLVCVDVLVVTVCVMFRTPMGKTFTAVYRHSDSNR